MRVWDEHWQRVLILFEVLEDLAPAGFLHRDYYHISDRRWHQIRQHRRLYIDRAWMGHWIAVPVNRYGAGVSFFIFQFVIKFFCNGIQYPTCFANDFWTDSITRKYSYFFIHEIER